MSKIGKYLGTSKIEAIGSTVILALGLLAVLMLLRVEKAPSGDGHGGHGHEGGEEEGHGEGSEGVELSADAIAFGEIIVEEASARTIVEKVSLRGRIATHGDKHLEIKPRFPGTVRAITKNIGDQVKAGELLARVESTSSKANFDVLSGLSGIVVDRDVSVGDFVTDDENMFSIVDPSIVWVELNAFQRDYSGMKVGQTVHIRDLDSTAVGVSTVSYISPIVDEDTQTFKVRCDLTNRDGLWRPGSFVEANVTVETSQTAVAVSTDAVQTFEGKSVIFVKNGEQFVAREVDTGKTDGKFIEVRKGLNAGEKYVAQNSFIVKAELLKSTAGHEH